MKNGQSVKSYFFLSLPPPPHHIQHHRPDDHHDPQQAQCIIGFIKQEIPGQEGVDYAQVIQDGDAGQVSGLVGEGHVVLGYLGHDAYAEEVEPVGAPGCLPVIETVNARDGQGDHGEVKHDDQGVL